MKHTTVVPDHHVADSPPMQVDTRRLAGELQKLREELLGLLRSKARDSKGVPPDEQGRPSRDGMDLDQRPQGHAFAPLIGSRGDRNGLARIARSAPLRVKLRESIRRPLGVLAHTRL